MLNVITIGLGAACGALLRFVFGIVFNPIFPTLPLGTLAANILGGFLMGLFMGLTKSHPFFPEPLRLGIATGFLGGLTTFSTFSAETVTLLTASNYMWGGILICAHVVGSLLATLFGLFTVKLIIS